MNTRTINAKYRTLLRSATPEQIEQAHVWYDKAHAVAMTVGINLGIDIERAASIVSAFSPRVHWVRNVRNATAFSLGYETSGLSMCRTIAENALVHGFNALKGPKTNAFARAIAGDSSAVVIDVHMINAAGMDSSKGINDSQYRLLEKSVRMLAKEFSMTPRECQALIWIIERGKAH